MTEKKILTKLAEIILDAINEMESVSLKSDIMKMGHFNGNIFNKEHMLNHNAITLGRFLTNIASYIGEKRFKRMMDEIRDLLWTTADDIDLLYLVNELHAKKKNNN